MDKTTPPSDPQQKIFSISERAKTFLTFFPNSVFTYIPDHAQAAINTSPILDLQKQEIGYGIFFSVNGFHSSRRVSENLTNVNAFFCDIDYPDKINKTPEAIKTYKNDMVMELTSGNTPSPTFIVETKNGLHVYWCFEAPIYLNALNPEQQDFLRKEYVQIEEAILKRFDGDPGAKDVARVLRVPDTLHQKDPADPFKVKISFYEPEMRYKYSDIRKAFLVQSAPEAWATVVGENAINDDVKKKIEEVYPRLERPSFKGLLDQTASIPEGMRNKALLVVAHACKEAGWTVDKTYAHFQNFYGLHLREIRKTIHSAYEHKYDFGYKNEIMAQLAPAEEKTKLSEITSKVLSKNSREKKATNTEAQKEMFLAYEHAIAERYPNLKYKLRGDFYDYKNGMYVPLMVSEIQSIFFREMMGDGLMNFRKISAVNDKIACFKSIQDRVFRQEDENPDPNILNFKNGLLHLETAQLKPHTPEYLSTAQIPIEYDADAKCPQWLRFVHEIMSGDAEQVLLLQQIAGYILTADTRFAKAFIFYGYGANGKSLFTRMISKFVGKENVSNVNLTMLNKQFGLTGIIGKRLNLIDEISGNYFESNIIKTIISGERVSAEIKYRPEPIEFEPTVKLLFSVNELPKINDTTPGLYRRFLIVPFERTFADNPDLDLEKKLSTELPGILNWAINGLKILREKGRFNETEKNFEAMRIFKTENSPVVEFVNDMYQATPEGEESSYSVKVSELYQQYREYCFANGYKPKALSNFSRELMHTRIDGFRMAKKVVHTATVITGLRRKATLAGEMIQYPIGVQHGTE